MKERIEQLLDLLVPFMVLGLVILATVMVAYVTVVLGIQVWSIS